MLGRVWLHEVGALPSSLHQKVKIPYNDDIIVIQGDPERAITPKDSPVLGIGHNDIQLGGFSYEPKVQTLTTQTIKYLPPDSMATMSPRVVEIMRKMKFMPGIGLGKYRAGIAQMVEPYQQPSCFAGLGYQGKTVEIKKIVYTGNSLNSYFVKEGEDFPYLRFQEPWVNNQGKRQPGLEIFFEEELRISESFTHTFSS